MQICNPLGRSYINDLYETTCMTHNRFSNFNCVYTIIQVVHTGFIKVVLTKYSAFKSLSKIIQEFREKQVRVKETKEKTLCETLA